MKIKKDKEIVLITNYFPPEKGAASNRIYSLVKGLSENNYKVKVICPLPNYPKGSIFPEFKRKIYSKKEEEYATIFRLWLWPSNSSNKFIRLLSMLSFSLSLSLFFILKKTPKKVIIQYSPVFVGFTGVFWSSFFRKKIILNVSDLWPLAGLEMGLLQKGTYYSLLQKMERFCYKKSHLILGQSQEILNHIKKEGFKKELFLYRNIPDFKPPLLQEKPFNNDSIRIVYAGLLGMAQGLYNICSQINLPNHIQLHIYGNGPEAEKINMLKKKNIFYHGELERKVLNKKLEDFHLAFIPLNKRIYGSVPSKIFEQSRIGLPLLYFAGGEGEDIVEKHKLGWTIPVDDLKGLQDFFNTLSSQTLEEFNKKEVQLNAINGFDFSEQFRLLIRELEKI